MAKRFVAPMSSVDKIAQNKAITKAAYVPPTVDFISGSAGADSEVVRVSGLKSLEENLLMMGQVAMDAAGTEMANIAAEVIADAQANYTPFRSGDLIASGQSDPYEADRNGIKPTITQIAMWFGAPQTGEALAAGIHDTSRYAEIQHEDLEFKHEIGGNKYLEKPFNKAEPTFLPRVAGAIEAALIGNGSIVDLGSIEVDLNNAPDYPGYGK